MMDREELGLKIYEVTKNHSDGYRRNIGQFNTPDDNETAEKCACAASNTGYFILTALGYTKNDMDRFRLALDTPSQITPNQAGS